MMRNTPEALRFIDKAKRQGVNAAIAERDGPFYQYSRARRLVLPPSRRGAMPNGARKTSLIAPCFYENRIFLIGGATLFACRAPARA